MLGWDGGGSAILGWDGGSSRLERSIAVLSLTQLNMVRSDSRFHGNEGARYLQAGTGSSVAPEADRGNSVASGCDGAISADPGGWGSAARYRLKGRKLGGSRKLGGWAAP